MSEPSPADVVAMHRDVTAKLLADAADARRCLITASAYSLSPLLPGLSSWNVHRLFERTRDESDRVLKAFAESDMHLREVMKHYGMMRRRRISAKQVALAHVAKRELDVDELSYRYILNHIGRVESTADLDTLAFDRLMQFFAALGFRSQSKKKGAEAESFGRRTNMATPAQIDLIRSLWVDWTSGTGACGDAELNAWLAKFHKVSALRFVDAAKAGKVINALRAMVARKAEHRTA